MTIPSAFQEIYSLGHNCQVATQLRKNGLRRAAGPWDWFNFASTSEFCKVIRNRMDDFMQLPNLEIYAKSVNTYYVRDRSSSCLSFHDFKNDPRKAPLYDYPIFRERLDRRLTRFHDALDSDRSVLLVRMIPHRKDAQTIYDTIRDTYSNANITYLFVMLSRDSQIFTLPTFSEHVNIIQIPKGHTWEGDTASWNQILSPLQAPIIRIYV